MSESASSLNRAQWLNLLERLADELSGEGPPVRLCLIGSSACLLEGMPGRISRDLDVWQPASDFDLLELKRAAENSGLLFDPRDSILPDKPYIQLIRPGPTQLGVCEPILWARMSRLHIYIPPWANWIASKLVRGDARDVEDVLFLADHFGISAQEVRNSVETMPEPARQHALENLIYLEIIQP